jgi:hypothetical protein
MKWFTNRRYKLRHLNSKDSESNNRLDDYDEVNNDHISSINKSIYRPGTETASIDDQSIVSEKSSTLAETSSSIPKTSKTNFDNQNGNCIFYEIID